MIVLLPLVALVIPVICLYFLRPTKITRIGPNALVGIRTRATTGTAQAWETAHSIAWPYVKTANYIFAAVLIIVAVWAIVAEGSARDAVAGLGIGFGTLVWFTIMMLGAAKGHRGAVKREEYGDSTK